MAVYRRRSIKVSSDEKIKVLAEAFTQDPKSVEPHERAKQAWKILTDRGKDIKLITMRVFAASLNDAQRKACGILRSFEALSRDELIDALKNAYANLDIPSDEQISLRSLAAAAVPVLKERGFHAPTSRIASFLHKQRVAPDILAFRIRQKKKREEVRIEVIERQSRPLERPAPPVPRPVPAMVPAEPDDDEVRDTSKQERSVQQRCAQVVFDLKNQNQPVTPTTVAAKLGIEPWQASLVMEYSLGMDAKISRLKEK